MTFAVLTDLQARFGAQEVLQLADRDGDGQVDAGVVEAALQDADAEIVGLIGQVVDPANVPLNLVRLACDIARYRLYGSNPPDDVRARYKDATGFLTQVRAGSVQLDGGPSAPTTPSDTPKAAATQAQPRRFTRDLS